MYLWIALAVVIIIIIILVFCLPKAKFSELMLPDKYDFMEDEIVGLDITKPREVVDGNAVSGKYFGGGPFNGVYMGYPYLGPNLDYQDFLPRNYVLKNSRDRIIIDDFDKKDDLAEQLMNDDIFLEKDL